MEASLPMLNSLLQHTLRSFCACSDSSTPSKWVYAVFWKILPRNYPPPKWDHGGTLLDRAKGNKRNWILVWEDGFCDFFGCERAGNEFGADIFFKLTHEVYNFGEGLVGKVAADNSHKWVFRDSPQETDPSFISSWNVSIDPQPRAWEAQFSSGIETIALISVREGAIQLGSFDKVVEDLNMVLNIQRKFSFIQSIPGIYAIQRPFLQIHEYNNAHAVMQTNVVQDKQHQVIGFKRQIYEQLEDLPSKSLCLGYTNDTSGGLPMWSIPPLLPSNISGGAFFSKIPSTAVPHYGTDHDNIFLGNLKSHNKLKVDECFSNFDEVSASLDVKVEMGGVREEGVREEKSCTLNQGLRLV
ncbi:hypothetical protein ACS0TY_023542 [Phlomoides rotata]